MIDLVSFDPSLREELFAFLERCLPESGRAFDPAGRHAHLKRVEEDFDGFWCLVENSGPVVGCAGVRPLEEGVCELKTLFVLERLQGLGWGRRLAEHAVAWARERGWAVMRLDTLSSSENAVALYRRLGFQDRARYGDNPLADVFMELHLA